MRKIDGLELNLKDMDKLAKCTSVRRGFPSREQIALHSKGQRHPRAKPGDFRKWKCFSQAGVWERKVESWKVRPDPEGWAQG